jgi:hypothetical protein
MRFCQLHTPVSFDIKPCHIPSSVIKKAWTMLLTIQLELSQVKRTQWLGQLLASGWRHQNFAVPVL